MIDAILEAMQRYGGGFVKQLAVLYRQGDAENQAKLRAVFANYFRAYEDIAHALAAKDGHTDEVTK